jgi:hypothetical protein
MHAAPFPYARMARKWDALDRLDLQFRWGNYGIRVLRFHLIAFPPGHVIYMHQHSEFEFHFIPKGKGKVTLAGRHYDLHGGLFYLTAPGVLHEQKSDPEDPMHELCLHCEIVPLSATDSPSDDWGGSIEALEAHHCVTGLREMPAVPAHDRYNAMGLFLEAYLAWESQQPGFYTTIKQSLVHILLRALRVHSPTAEPAVIPERDMSDYRFRLAAQ